MRHALLALALAAAACSGAPPHPRPTAPSTAVPSRFGPPDAVLGSTGLVKVLPDTCQAVRPFLEAEMSAGTLFDSYEAGEYDVEECVWYSYGTTSAHVFKYDLATFPSRDGAAQDMAARRRPNAFSQDYQCRYTGKVRDIVGLGVSAFAVPCEFKKATPHGFDDDHVYELSGLVLDVQVRNVILRIEWAAATYPASAARKNPHWLHGGKGLPHGFDEAYAFVERIAWQVLAHFP